MILSFIERSREARKENPFVRYGYIIFNAGLILLSSGVVLTITLKTPQIQFALNLDASVGWFLLIFGAAIATTGIIFIIVGQSSLKREWLAKRFYYLKGLDNQTIFPPLSSLPKMALLYHQTPILLTIKNQDINTIFEDLIFSKKIIEEKIEQYQSKDIFFAGLARVPCLFFIGYSFRNAHSTITLIEHDHRIDQWIKLEKVDEPDIDLIIEYQIENEVVKYNNIAITIEFTSEILKDELPSFLQDSIVRIKSKSKFTHNLIKSQTTLRRIVEEIINELIRLNKRCNRLHLFISAQSTVVFELGRRYQDGMIGDITIYNYDPIRKGYPWAISLTNKEIKLEGFE
jgi:hypothetical protein